MFPQTHTHTHTLVLHRRNVLLVHVLVGDLVLGTGAVVFVADKLSALLHIGRLGDHEDGGKRADEGSDDDDPVGNELLASSEVVGGEAVGDGT